MPGFVGANASTRSSVSRLFLTGTVRIRLFPLCLLVLPVFVSCGDDGRIWGYEDIDFLERIRSGQTEFLLHIDYEEVDPTDIYQLHPGAPLYLADVFADLGLFSMYRTLLAEQIRDGTEPYALHAARALSDHLTEGRQYSRVLESADDLFASHLDDNRVRGNVAAAAFAVGEYRQAAEYASALDGGDEKRLYLAAAEVVERAESEADSASAGQSPEAPGSTAVPPSSVAVDDLLRASSVSQVHRRFSDFLLVLNPPRPALNPDQSQLLAAKLMISDGLSTEAVDPLGEAIASSRDEWGEENVSGLLFDYFVAAARADRRVESAELLIGSADAVEETSPDAAFAALEYAGRTLRAGGLLSAATPVLARARDLAPTPADRTRVLRYWFDTVARRPDADHVAALYALYGATDSPEAFDDMVSRLLHSKMHRREWRSLAETARIAIDSGAPAARSEAAFLLAEVIRAGYVDGETVDLYEQSVEAGLASPYAAILAAARLGRSPQLVAADDDGRTAAPRGAGGDASGDAFDNGRRRESGTGRGGEGDSADSGREGQGGSGGTAPQGVPRGGEAAADTILDGHLFFSQLDAAYDLSRSANVSNAALLRLADRLADSGAVTRSMRTADLIPPDENGRHREEVTRLRYPQAFVSSLAPVAEEHAVDESVFFGLVRDESYFDPAVESWAGAIGLSQLMPATAEDVARRLRLEAPDLTDPATNLAIGGYYFSDLLERFESYAVAVAAYNAGMGRLRGWLREAPDLDVVLFVEWMPFAETRGHVKTVLVSAVFYGYLYANRDALDTVNLYFPGTVSP